MRFAPEMAEDLLSYCGFNIFHYIKKELKLDFLWLKEEDSCYFCASDINQETYEKTSDMEVNEIIVRAKILPKEILFFRKNDMQSPFAKIIFPYEFDSVSLKIQKPFENKHFKNENCLLIDVGEQEQELVASPNGIFVNGLKILTETSLRTSPNEFELFDLLNEDGFHLLNTQRAFLIKKLVEPYLRNS